MKNEKISLCIITGNCEMYIGRFLDHFEKIADEIVVVRAIGSQCPDRTLSIAESRGCKVGEYQNTQGTAEITWPHIDNFAAARNYAFSLGSHEWLMWADTDDIISEASCKRLREVVDELPLEIDLISIPYNVPEHGHLRLMKERLARRGSVEWENEVHECMKPAPGKSVKIVTVQDAEVVHMPDGEGDNRAEHTDRNLRILESIPEAERGATHCFFLHKEYLGRQEHAKAVEYGLKYLEFPDSAQDERYEVLYVLGALSTDRETAAEFFHATYKCDPRRAEALAELSHLALRDNQPQRALAYARAMKSLPVPEPAPWSLRWHCYGSLGTHILCRSLRANGKNAEAVMLEDAHFKASDGIISLIHATRGRPEMATRAMKNWMDRARYPERIEHFFVIDSDDEASKDLPTLFRTVVVGQDAIGSGCVRAWNEGAKKASGKILIQMSDDWMPPMHWDKAIIERIGNPDESKVLAVSDGSRTDQLLCMAILTKARLEQQGFMFHPDFSGMYSDNYFTYCAYRDGVVTEARDLVFEHLHPAFGKGEMDENYQRQNAPAEYEKGKAIYERLTNE